ncbi:LSU ribosomal protein L4P [Anseongella ginsenosidimutans]|uniref:Large ribosomal subunit protein uL4 n=1 Tax=Anseongella ginsenosidimutans TaxID=496056 RepID=A0A4R3KMF8_9SPHI|nr:50S ribosomal protein L4 [Anseongella ginsenosidimutans]QEC54059.1 50S ribosomal protein L4 [Anseongella ginsenosidimutans]TCS85176.1 LSU ribosomal protein L4P [Anseongella ginsenosidimutans]
MELKVFDITGKETGNKVTLSDEVFGIEPNDHAIYLDVKQYLANQRQGTSKSKQRNEISGSTRKLHRQKGTGGSRKGSIKSPVFRGGGRIFGPQPRDYGFKLNKKTKKLARKSALSHKAKENNIVVLADFNFDAPKTKNYLNLINSLKLDGVKSMLVLPGNDKNIFLSSRNLQKANVISAGDLNTYDVLNAGKLLITESAVKTIEEAFTK